MFKARPNFLEHILGDIFWPFVICKSVFWKDPSFLYLLLQHHKCKLHLIRIKVSPLIWIIQLKILSQNGFHSIELET